MSSLYVHIPFCRTKCPYCDFMSLRCDERDVQEAYIERCIALLRSRRGMSWQTAYIGGGTPSVLAPDLLARLLSAIECDGEFTIECNPSSVTPAFAQTIAAGGVNRVSMGLQSILPRERAALGRTGEAEMIERAIHLIQTKNLSLDVMLGVPYQTKDSLTRTLEFCEKAGAKHISAYLLKIEEGTRFHAKPPAGLPDEDAQAQLYLYACEWLEYAGYMQYEISNFARPGYESEHNLNYWRCGAYFAIGPGAHGFTQGRRWHYTRDLDTFMRGEDPIDDGPGGDDTERAMLALRLREGIANPTEAMRERAKSLTGYVELDEKGLRLKREGFLLSNIIIAKLLL